MKTRIVLSALLALALIAACAASGHLDDEQNGIGTSPSLDDDPIAPLASPLKALDAGPGDAAP